MALIFVGNIEALDIPTATPDVLVCDGFTGNIVLKISEGYLKMFSGALKSIFYKNLTTKLSALCVKSGLKEFKHRFDYSEFPVAPLLGVDKSL